MKVAVLGPKGTFSEKAYLEYKKSYSENDYEVIYCATIEEVFNSISSEECNSICDIAIVPIENTLDGYVQRTLDLLLQKKVYILDEIIIPVAFSLVGNVENIKEIKKLYVQFKTNGQCRQFIGSLNDVEIITTESNMESYYRIADDEGVAAIVPSHIVNDSSKRFCIKDVTDSDKNHTRFVVFKSGNLDVSSFQLKDKLEGILNNQNTERNKSEKISQQSHIKLSLFIMPTVDRPGILFDILRRFYDNKINLISIMSRPTRHEMGTYNFYIEIDSSYQQMDMIIDTLNQIHVYNDIKILGIYVD